MQLLFNQLAAQATAGNKLFALFFTLWVLSATAVVYFVTDDSKPPWSLLSVMLASIGGTMATEGSGVLPPPRVHITAVQLAAVLQANAKLWALTWHCVALAIAVMLAYGGAHLYFNARTGLLFSLPRLVMGTYLLAFAPLVVTLALN